MSQHSMRAELLAAGESEERKTIRALIARMEPELVKSLQDPSAAERLARHYLTAIRLTPALYECTPESLLAALLLSAQVGLEPGPLGHVYLVPYKTECTWILGYTGMIELARRTGLVGALRSRVVWDNDACRVWEDEKGEHFTFTEGDESERRERRFVVVTWKERAGGTWFPRVLRVPSSRIERARKASPAAQRGTGPWVTDESSMWAKTGIRAARPWLPLTPEAGYAIALDETPLVGVTVDDAGAAQPEPLTDAAPDAEPDAGGDL